MRVRVRVSERVRVRDRDQRQREAFNYRGRFERGKKVASRERSRVRMSFSEGGG